jgi:hypothetical protein
MEDSGDDLSYQPSTLLQGLRNITKTHVWTDHVPAEILTEHLLHAIQDCYRYSKPLGP